MKKKIFLIEPVVPGRIYGQFIYNNNSECIGVVKSLLYDFSNNELYIVIYGENNCMKIPIRQVKLNSIGKIEVDIPAQPVLNPYDNLKNILLERILLDKLVLKFILKSKLKLNEIPPISDPFRI